MGLAILGLGCLAVSQLPALAQSGTSPRQSSTSIRTPDFDESVRWYQDKLGFRLIADQNFVQGRSAVLERSGFLVEVTEVDHLLQETRDPHATGNVTSVPVISILVPDVDEEIARLSKAGVEVLQEPADELDGRYRTAQIRDNGRHRIELREPINEGGFNATGR
nr:VOC family protein [Microvirga solisilvae]